MKTSILLDVHYDYFSELDPYGFLEKEDAKDRVCLGTVIEQKDGGDDIPAALMILKMEEQKTIVEWLFVRPEFRYHGLGASLMAHAFKSAEASGMDKLYLKIDKLPGRNRICLYKDDFFKEYSFKEEEENLYSASVDDYFDAVDSFEQADNVGYWSEMEQ